MLLISGPITIGILAVSGGELERARTPIDLYPSGAAAVLVRAFFSGIHPPASGS